MPALERHHLAVVSGPGLGWVVPLGAEQATVGRAEHVDLSVPDPLLSREHLGARDRGGRVRVRDLGSANGTVLRAARRSSHGSAESAGSTGSTRLARKRRLGHRWQSAPVGSLVISGSTVLQVRAHPALRDLPEPEQPVSDGLLGRLLLPVLISLTMIPLLLSGGGGGWRILLMLAMPLAIVGAVLWPVLRERARRRLRRPGPDPVPPPRVTFADPAEALAWPGAAPGPDEQGWELGNADERAPRPTRPGRVLSPRHLRLAEALRHCQPPAAGEGIALVGEPAAVRGLGRWVVARTAATRACAVLAPEDWGWAAPLAERTPDGDPSLRVHDLTSTEPSPTYDPDAAHLVLAARVADVPPWCTTVIAVRPVHDRLVSEQWAEEFVTALAAHRPDAGRLPAQIHLGALLGPAEHTQLLDIWSQNLPGLPGIVGAGQQGPVELDLAQDGPHALVAGTTGSGKSELLVAWILAIAHARSPQDVSFVLIDYKGGATFGPLWTLRHVVGLVTDLDAAATARALASLRAELHHRERLLAAVGANDLTGYERLRPDGSEALGRLVVVVDEFRAMADAHPDQLDALVRLAAQGRSLGIHLVLATQRPGGAITADMRANLTTRLCLRVLEESDAQDAIGESTPARLPRIPGRAVLRTEGRQVLQAAWCGPAQTGWLTERISQLNAAADALEQRQPWRRARRSPWAPPLPERCTPAELAGHAGSAPAGARFPMPIARTDVPEEQRLGTWYWPGGTLLVSGPAGTGRTTVLQTVVEASLRVGTATHVIAEGAGSWDSASAPAAGTWCDPEDVRRVRRMLVGLGRGEGPALLAIDDIDTVLAALEETGAPGEGAELLGNLLRRSRRIGLDLLLTAPAPAHRWAGVVDRHLVLCPRDQADAVMAGVPRELVGTGWPPGRGVLVERGGAVTMQIAVTEPDAGAWGHPPSPPWRIRPLPDMVALPSGPDQGEHDAADHSLILGRGGDDAGLLRLHPRPGQTWLVAGPPGSGRTTTVLTLITQLRALGWQIAGEPRTVSQPMATTTATDGVGAAVVIDDADRLTSGRLPDGADDPQTLLIAATRPDGALTAAHPLGARLREADVTIALAGVPLGHLPPALLRPHQEPESPPGRAVLLHRGRATPLQVAMVAAAGPGESEDGVGVARAGGGSQ
ncbi:FHA domain-containing protein [Ruania alkalisoli]|uniref:FHA domain-containing protein n=1 Tax=Ruania alkalisoli TaxID=2779775 RepID=A0A7M1SW83_9MICO|nr:FtsK/SpoIIIE domain-containing protein [Ruania alkalisoli]QOR71829.1 FHA domain-containing protein [Ruania alkalisoli]